MQPAITSDDFMPDILDYRVQQLEPLSDQGTLWLASRPKGINHYYLQQLEASRNADPILYFHRLLVLVNHWDSGHKPAKCDIPPVFYWRVNGRPYFSSCVRFEVVMAGTRAAHALLARASPKSHTRAAAIFLHVILPSLNAWKTRQDDVMPLCARPFGARMGLCLAIMARQMDSFQSWELGGRIEECGPRWLKWMVDRAYALNTLSTNARLLKTTVASCNHIIMLGHLYAVMPKSRHSEIQAARAYFERRGDAMRVAWSDAAHASMVDRAEREEAAIMGEVCIGAKKELINPYGLRERWDIAKGIHWTE